MKKPQWITSVLAITLVAIIYYFGRTTPLKNKPAPTSAGSQVNYTDTILRIAKSRISPEQAARLVALENSVSRGAVKQQQLDVYHQLAHFWLDSAGLFPPYAWYEAESARLENSEKSLTFAARLFLDNLEGEQSPDLRRWKALQAKDLLERSLIINPANDSAKVALAACYLFGNISADPMDGIKRIRQVLEKDSANIYALMTMTKASILSAQYDKAIDRLQTINRLQSDNLEAVLMLADMYERTGDRVNAVKWYEQSLPLIHTGTELGQMVERRIKELKK